MSETRRVTITAPGFGPRVAKVLASASAIELVDVICWQWPLPRHDEAGRSLRYELTVDGRRLEPEQSLSGIGALDGATLALIPIVDEQPLASASRSRSITGAEGFPDSLSWFPGHWPLDAMFFQKVAHLKQLDGLFNKELPALLRTVAELQVRVQRVETELRTGKANGHSVVFDEMASVPATPPVDVVKSVCITLSWDSARRQSFELSGDLGYSSATTAEPSIDATGLRGMVGMVGQGRNGADRRLQHDASAMAAQMQREGWRLWQQMFQANDELARELGAARRVATQGEDLSFCFLGPRSYLGIPFEWLHDGKFLGVHHPIYQSVTGIEAADRRLPKNLFERPLRVLLIASTSPSDDDEIDAIADHVHQTLASLRAQAPSVTLVHASDASSATLTALVERQVFDIVHIAGETVSDHVQQNTRVIPLTAAGPNDAITPPLIHHWALHWRPMLVYLSAGRSAVADDDSVLVRDDYLGLVDALVMAGVPNVIGLRWPLDRVEQSTFARHFYRGFLQTRSVVRGIYRARHSVYLVGRGPDTWASPILVAQQGE